MMDGHSNLDCGVVCGIAFVRSISDPLLAARSHSALRVFACRVARLGISQCDCPDADVVSALNELERRANASETLDDLESRRKLVAIAANVEDERAEEQNAAIDSGRISVAELDDSWECARAYEAVLACFKGDPLFAAASVVDRTRWAFNEDSEEDFERRILPLLRELR